MSGVDSLLALRHQKIAQIITHSDKGALHLHHQAEHRAGFTALENGLILKHFPRQLMQWCAGAQSAPAQGKFQAAFSDDEDEMPAANVSTSSPIQAEAEAQDPISFGGSEPDHGHRPARRQSGSPPKDSAAGTLHSLPTACKR